MAGQYNANVSEKVFDFSLVDDCNGESQIPGEVLPREKVNPYRDIGVGMYSLIIEAKND